MFLHYIKREITLDIYVYVAFSFVVVIFSLILAAVYLSFLYRYHSFEIYTLLHIHGCQEAYIMNYLVFTSHQIHPI